MSMKNIASDSSKSILTAIQEGDIQPNAVDLRLGKVFEINPLATFQICEDKKVHRGSEEIFADNEGWFRFTPGHYEVIMENEITVGEGEAGWVITRSTLNRNGLFLTSGLYDTGYQGVMAGVLHVTIGDAWIKRGTRIGQYLSFHAEALHHYDGDYGKSKVHDDKYK